MSKPPDLTADFVDQFNQLEKDRDRLKCELERFPARETDPQRIPSSPSPPPEVLLRLTEERDRLSRENQDLDRQVNELTQLLHAAEKRVQEHVAVQQTSQDQLARLDKVRQELQQEVDRVTQDLNTARSPLSRRAVVEPVSSEDRITLLQYSLAEANEKVGKFREEIRELRRKLMECQSPSS